MKKWKKLLALCLAFTMIFSMSVPSYAADTEVSESELEQQYEAKAAEVIRGFGFDENTSDYDKVVAIQTWIDDYVKYDWYWYRYISGLKTDGYVKHTDYPNSKYGALLDGYSVCGGYAEIFEDLANKCGLTAIEVVGNLGNTGHAWDIVKVNDESYFIDPTNAHRRVEDSQYFLYGTNSSIGSHILGSEDKKIEKDYAVKEYNYRYYHTKCSHHKFVKGPNSESATCTLDGYDIYYCSNDAEGNETGEYGCNAYYKVKIPMTGHDLGEPEVTKEATCEKEGEITRVCKTCKKKITESIPALGHDFDYDHPVSDNRVCYISNPRPQTVGRIGFKCKNCDTIEYHNGNEEGYQLPHTYTVISDTATCTEAGTITKMCLVERADNKGVTYNGKKVCGHTVTEPSPAKGHDYEITVENEATCYTAKTVRKDCKICHDTTYEYYDRNGNKLESNYRESHTWDDGVVTKEPTCTEPGVKTYTCIYADDEEHHVEDGDGVKTEVILATGHQHLERRNVSATYTGDIYCLDCKALVQKGEEITHHWDAGTVTKVPTCTEAGEKVYHCTDDGCNETKTEAVKATGHNWNTGTVTTAPKCESTGVKTFTCTACGEEKTETIPATGHQHKELRNEKAASCTEKGYTGDTWCTDCNKKIESGKDIPVLAHDYKETSRVAATCKEAGKVTYTCTKCGDVKTETLPKTEDHVWDSGKITTDPTCETDGVKTYTCTVCGETKPEPVKATGHSWDSGKVTTASTCEKDGVKTYTCNTCHKTKTETVKVTGHSWDGGQVTTAPKCETDGVKTYTCTSCHATRTEKLNKTGHQHKEVRNKKAATCSSAGYTGDTYCTDCGKKTEPGSEIPKLNHRWNGGAVTKAPTCEAAGVRTYTCTACGATRNESIAATGHQHTAVRGAYGASCTSQGYTGDTYCTDCGKTLAGGSYTNALGHSWGGIYTATAASAVSEGRDAHSCVRCGYTESWATGRLASSGNFNATNFPLQVKKSYTIRVENMAAGDYVTSWRSSNTKVATVAGNGKVTAQKKTGSTTISAVLASGRVISTTIKVQKGSVKSNKVVVTSPRSLTLRIRQGAQIQAVRYPVTSSQGLSYSTSNKKVATVNKKGYITAQKKTGKATITVKSGSKKVKITVKVIP